MQPNDPHAPTDPRHSPEWKAVNALLRKQDWASIQDKLLRFAIYRCRSKDLAEDLVQEALRRVFDPKQCSWDPEKYPLIAHHLMGVVNSLLSKERTSARARHDEPLEDEEKDADEKHELAVADHTAVTPEAYATMDLHTRRLHLLRERLTIAKDMLALRVLAIVLSGIEEPGPIAEALGLTRDEVVYTRRRLHRAAAQVARDLPHADAPPPKRGEEISP